MKFARIASIVWTLLFAATLASCGKQEEAKADKAADVKAKAEADVQAMASAAKELEAREIAVDAYIYAYPLVTMEMTRRYMVGSASPSLTSSQ